MVVSKNFRRQICLKCQKEIEGEMVKNVGKQRNVYARNVEICETGNVGMDGSIGQGQSSENVKNVGNIVKKI